jgi:hypothetical protein
MAHGAGGRLVAGAIRLKDKDDRIGHLRAGEVVELSVTKASQLTMMLGRLDHGLVTFHLRAVPVAQLIRDAGSSV